MRKLLVGVSLAAAAAGFGSGASAQRTKPTDIPVHTYLIDLDAAGDGYTLQSDGLGAYANGTAGVISVLMANVFNNLYDGDWEMDAAGSTFRKVAVTLSPTNAIPAGSAGYTIPPNPPFWGRGFEAARLIDKCTENNKDVLTMQPGTTITCPLLVRWSLGSSSYRLDMGTPIEAPESTAAQISCNSANAGGCTDWYLDPMPVMNADGTVSAGRSIARLVSVAKNGSVTNLGGFYMTFHVHVTRP